MGLSKSGGYVEEKRSSGRSFIQRCLLSTYFVKDRHGLCFQAAHRGGLDNKNIHKLTSKSVKFYE